MVFHSKINPTTVLFQIGKKVRLLDLTFVFHYEYNENDSIIKFAIRQDAEVEIETGEMAKLIHDKLSEFHTGNAVYLG